MFDDGPLTLPDRTIWFKNGSIHRTDGPAIECTDGRHLWCLNGIEVTEKEVIAYRQQMEQEASDLSDKLLAEQKFGVTVDHEFTVGPALKLKSSKETDKE
jgi:hypothetical protein